MKAALLAVDEMQRANHSDETLPLEGVDDIDRDLAVIKIPGTFLEVKDLLKVRRMLDAFHGLHHIFAVTTRTDIPHIHSYHALATRLTIFPSTLGLTIDKAIDPASGLVKETMPLWRWLKSARVCAACRDASIRFTSVLRLRNCPGWLDADASPAVRDGRLVLPVPPMNKRKIPGIVRDQSASGKTIFIEPAEVVEANNLTRELQLEEHREIIPNPTAIADELRPHIPEMLAGAGVIYNLDFINAKAHYAEAVGASLPNLHDREEMEWYHACHPVLKLSLEHQGREIRAIDIALNRETRILVISGPECRR